MSELLLNGGGTGWPNAILAGLLLFTLRATVVLLGAWGATRLLRAGSAATRHLVWTAAIVAVLVLPLLTVVTPTWNVPVVTVAARFDAPLAAASLEAPASTPRAAAPEPVASTTAAVSPQVARFSEVAASAPSSWTLPELSITATDVVAASWIAVLVILIIRLAIANARVLSWRRASRLVEDSRWNALLRRLTREYGIERPVVLLESAETDVPVTWGIVYPVVLIPAAAVEWDEEQRIAVLTHELAHVKRFDAFSQMLAQLALALLWFHPLAWLAVRRMRMEREHACDDFVLAAGARASRYADDLLGLARRLARPTAPAAAALAMARRSELEGRLLAILDPSAKRDAVRGARVAALTLLMIVLTIPVAAFSPGARIVTAPLVQRPATTIPDARSSVPRIAQPAAAPLPRRDSALSDAPMRIALDSVLSMSSVVARLPDRIPNLTIGTVGAAIVAPLRALRDTEPKPVEVQTLVDVTRGAKRMTSDYEKGQLLGQVAKLYVRNDTLRDAYIDAVISMTSDYERSKALLALLERDSVPASHTVMVIRAAKMMSSDFSRAQVLRKISPATFADSTVQRAYVDLLGVMSSNTERANAIAPLVKSGPLTPNIQIGLLRAITALTGNTEKGNLLVAFFESQGTADPAVRRAFLKSAETLTSDSDYRRVMMALMR